MTLPNGEQPLELREAKGPILGFFVPEKDFRELVGERDALRKELAELTALVEQLRQDRDNYARILEVWENEGVAPLTRREVEGLEREGLPFAAVVAEIEMMIRPSCGASEDDAQPR
jgi:hypothetical protein